MNYLLDTHAFLWLAAQSGNLSESACRIMAAEANTLLLSLASVWEIQIKTQLGKLALKKPLADIIAEQQTANQIEILPITLAHILKLGELPNAHKDPFDRLLIAQALVEDVTLITKDPQIAQYPVQIVW